MRRPITRTWSRFGRRWWVAATVLWEPRDLWVGVFWRSSVDDGEDVLHVYVCLVPCVPLHMTFRRNA